MFVKWWKECQEDRRHAVLHTYLTKDLSSSLILFHFHGAISDPWGTLGIVVVVRLVLIL